jgi:hypothetical protein
MPVYPIADTVIELLILKMISSRTLAMTRAGDGLASKLADCQLVSVDEDDNIGDEDD